MPVMQSAPSAFFIIGLLIWGIRSVFKSQVESVEELRPQPIDASRIHQP